MTEPIFTPEDERFLAEQAQQLRAGMLEPGTNSNASCRWCGGPKAERSVCCPSCWDGIERYIVPYMRSPRECVPEITPYTRNPSETLLRDEWRKDAPRFVWDRYLWAFDIGLVLGFMLSTLADWWGR